LRRQVKLTFGEAVVPDALAGADPAMTIARPGVTLDAAGRASE
jgi:hypothetical protein